MLYKILYVKNAEDLKKFLKNFLLRMSGVLLPILFFIFYLMFNKILTDFMDYAVFGIGTFSNSINYISLFDCDNICVKILSYVFPVQLIIMFVIYVISFKKKELEENEWFRNFSLMLVYSIGTIVVMFPITDKVHFTIGSICTMITFLYLVYVLIYSNLKNKEKIKRYIEKFLSYTSKFLLIIMICYSVYQITGYIKNEERRTDINHFENTIIEEYLYDRIIGVGNCIKDQENQGIKVYVLDMTSPLFSIPLDIYNKNYDMFNKGNFGAKGEERNYRGFGKTRKYNGTY